MGLNLGGFLAPLVCGTLGEIYGWHYGFGAAGVGMFAGLIIYATGRKYLPAGALKERVLMPSAPSAPVTQPNLWLVLLGVGVAATIFRGAYEQTGNTISLWTDLGVDRGIGGHIIPMTWFQALNPLLVIALTPLLLFYWRRQARGETPPARKMATGAMILAAAYLLLATISAGAGSGRANWLWLVVFFIILTLGELYILPTGGIVRATGSGAPRRDNRRGVVFSHL